MLIARGKITGEMISLLSTWRHSIPYRVGHYQAIRNNLKSWILHVLIPAPEDFKKDLPSAVRIIPVILSTSIHKFGYVFTRPIELRSTVPF